MKPIVQIIGEDGNVFGIIAKAQRAVDNFNLQNPDNKMNWDSIQKEMLSGDYDHVLQTVMKYFEVR